MATLEVDTDGPHADTAWIVPVGHAPREPIECFAVPDARRGTNGPEPSTPFWPRPDGHAPDGSCAAGRR
ncbi:hypothetical protein BJF85_10255 [Saccharomonospora sp. CUA-673]|nr:hypothetical protein BJF85_10255 [Saccharomonospora sp. CUA-673]